ncbi:MAG: hypothetical protein WCG87_04430 [Bacteroidota bacterium]
MNLRILIVMSIITLLVQSCNNGENLPDVSAIKLSLQTRRLDQDLAQLDTNQVAAGLQKLSAKYPDFLNFYLDTVLGFGIDGKYVDTSAAIQQGLRVFLTYKDYRGLFDTVAKHFPDTKQLDEQLTKGFQYMKFYNPNYVVPKVVYFTSGLQKLSAFTYEDKILCIGLDMYLGEKYPYYASVGIPEYMTAHLRPEYVLPNAFKVIYEMNHPFVTDKENTLLDMMIQRGKEQYFLNKVIPFCKDSAKLGYTQKQLDWCKGNEAMIYNFFVHENLLYDVSWQKVLGYVSEGPSATGMPVESPGNVGTYLGLQIVNAYMQQHPKMTMDELFRNTDAQRFLSESKYKPK